MQEIAGAATASCGSMSRRAARATEVEALLRSASGE
jgi:hypothetical protein